MNNTLQVNELSVDSDDSTGALKRAMVLLYGVAAYNIGVVGLGWLILAMAGIAPYGFGPIETGSVAASVMVNILLVAGFGLQHSVMARPAFKRLWTRIIPHAAERATYVLTSGVTLALVVWLWQPLPGTVWAVENTAASWALYGLFAFGWSYLMAATFVTNHFELFGLRQVYLHFRNQPYTELPFKQNWMYKYSRHPMMTGVLIGMWAVPVMSVAHFVLASAMSLYIVVGVYFEERDLRKKFGTTYREYKAQVAALLPRVF